jgi:tRNA(Ile)-lysidine synthetase-like protein
MLDTVKRTISDYKMLETGENVLAALSGGADSVALLLSLRELGYPVRAFHLNHCLRGAESDRDEAFCRRLCEKLGVELTVERVDIAAAAGDSAVEETARRIRYARLEHAAHGAKIAVAHNADDNLETMLFHLVRGTGAKVSRAFRRCADASFGLSSRLNGGKSKPFCASADRISSRTARTRTRLIRATASVKRSFPFCGN